MVFSVGLEYFFNPEPKPVLEIVRKKDRLRFPDSPDARKVTYYFESLDFPVPNRALNSYLAEFEPIDEEKIRLHEHPGIEFLYVLSGRLELRVGADKHELSEGDSIYFDSTVSHGYRRHRVQAHNSARGDAGTAGVRSSRCARKGVVGSVSLGFRSGGSANLPLRTTFRCAVTPE